jgi:DNA-binding LacI/PurR family transcriptional regulator
MDAVFVANDQMALSVLQLAAEGGLRVPQDLGVVGFDDIPESAYFWPPLTTVNQDQHQLGSSAVRVLIEMIDAEAEEEQAAGSKRLLLQPSLIVRASSLRDRSEFKGDEDESR